MYNLTRLELSLTICRVEFLETTMSPPVQGCSTDTFQILNSLDTPTVIQCGFLAGYQCKEN